MVLSRAADTSWVELPGRKLRAVILYSAHVVCEEGHDIHMQSS